MLKKITLSVIVYLLIAPAFAELSIPEPNKIHKVQGALGFQLAVQEWGNPKGKVILLSHPWSMTHMAWLPQINSDLASKYRLITYDLRGHGNSQKNLTP